jgi:hypothetical protein
MRNVPANRVLRYASWSAYLSAGLAIIGIVFTALFYALEAPHLVATRSEDQQFSGNLSDIGALFQYLFMLPLTVALYRLASSWRRELGWAAMALGVISPLTTVIAQALLVARVITFSVYLPFILAAFTLTGVWMVLANYLARRTGALPVQLTWLGELTGAAFASLGGLALVVFLVAERNPVVAAVNAGASARQHPVLIAIAIVVGIAVLLADYCGSLIWLIWLGRRLLAIAAAQVHEASLSRRQVAS